MTIRFYIRYAAVREIRYVVEARHVGDRREPQQQAVPATGLPGLLPAADLIGDREHGLLAVADNHRVQEIGDGFRVERRVAAGNDQGVSHGPFGRKEGDAGQVEHGQEVRIGHLGGEADAEHVEGADRPVRVHRELGHAMLAHEGFEVRPDGVGALGQHALALVQHLVEDLDALVGQPDLVGVRVAQRPPDVGAVPVLDDRAHLAADVLDRLAHARQQRLQGRVERFHRHQTRLSERAAAILPRSGSQSPGQVAIGGSCRESGPRPGWSPSMVGTCACLVARADSGPK